MNELHSQRQSVFICGFISGVGCAYSGFFSVMCGIIIGIFIKWSTVFDGDLEYLLIKTRNILYAILFKETPKDQPVLSDKKISKEYDTERVKKDE